MTFSKWPRRRTSGGGTLKKKKKRGGQMKKAASFQFRPSVLYNNQCEGQEVGTYRQMERQKEEE